MAEPESEEPGRVHFGGVAADAEAGEDDEAEGDADPAVEDHGAAGGDHDDAVPVWAVDARPGVGLEREHGVFVEDVGLHGKDEDDEDEGEDEEPEEAGLGEPGGSGIEDGGEVAAVDAQAVDDEDGVIGNDEA